MAKSSSKSSATKSSGRGKPLVNNAGVIRRTKKPYEGGGKINK